MREKKYIILLVIIVLAVVNYNNIFGGYYKNIEDAVRQNEYYQKTLEVFWVNENPLVFYLTNKSGISLVHIITKSKNNLILYKNGHKESVGLGYPYSVLTYNTLDINAKNSDVNAERILYGISSPSDINRIKVNGIDPRVIVFNKDGTEYCLWYIIGGRELDEYANKKLQSM